ncbi:MAG: hypothetical protein SGJ27_02760 [Candidatus Melainabacteria bacterium]|nr:hypothetical protein [Candidatus Melainabacteria bacterium]
MNNVHQALDALLDENKRAFAVEDYETAYHTLASAMHLAVAMISPDKLLQISETASIQRDFIDTNSPEHKYASEQARGRGNESIFSSLSNQAETASLIAKARLDRNEISTIYA